MSIAKSTKVKLDDLIEVEPLTENQEHAFRAYDNDDNLVLLGSPGTGKTFLALAFALETVLDKETPQKKIIIVRSVVPTREMGFLKGTKEEKEEPFFSPYPDIVDELVEVPEAWDRLVASGRIELRTTSFERGKTFHDAVVIFDECQNASFHELDTIITRAGENTRFIFSGDFYQSDFTRDNEREGVHHFMHILRGMSNFSFVTFTWKDIVRSGLVREYIMTKEMVHANGV